MNRLPLAVVSFAACVAVVSSAGLPAVNPGARAAIAQASPAAAAAWPQWRGPARDGVATAFTAPARWPRQLTRQWQATVGLGHSSPVVAGGRVFVIARQGDREVLQAFSAADGTLAWSAGYDAPYRVNPAAAGHGPGPKSTPAVAGSSVVTLGISGILSAHDASTGRLRWMKQPSKEQPLYGTAMSPLVDGNSVLAHVGGHESGAFTAFDLATGTVRWRWAAPPAYASPVAATWDGVRQYVTFSRTHVAGLSAADGTLIWQVPFTTDYDQNSVTPLVTDSGLVIVSGLASGTTALKPARRNGRWTADAAWKNPDVSMYMSSPVQAGDIVVGLSHRNRGQFFALDAATGKTLWTTRGREGDNAAIVSVGHGVLVALTTDATLIVARPDRVGINEIARYDVADGATWAHPALAGTQIFVKDVERLTAFAAR